MNRYIITKAIRAKNVAEAMQKEKEAEILGIGLDEEEEDKTSAGFE